MQVSRQFRAFVFSDRRVGTLCFRQGRCDRDRSISGNEYNPGVPRGSPHTSGGVMRVVTLVLAFVLAAGPALAQEQPSIRSSIEHAAAAASSEPSSDTSRHPLFWSGLALAAAGTMVAILGTTAFKSEET